MEIGDIVVITTRSKEFSILQKMSDQPIYEFVEVKTNEHYKGWVEQISTNGSLKIKIIEKG